MLINFLFVDTDSLAMVISLFLGGNFVLFELLLDELINFLLCFAAGEQRVDLLILG